MKKFIFTVIILILMLFTSSAVFAAAIITSPIDSRPISTDYLKNLAEIAGDTVLYPDKENMDYFSSTESENHFADSEKIRAEIRELVSQNNNKDTIVIINTSTYFTKGLVGSRCGVSYKDEKKAMQELKSLLTDYPEPSYYINLSMPRTLPETRFNKVWFDDKSLTGLGYYYLQLNPKCENKEYISQNLKTVNPIQFLMEYSYLTNKKNELGEDSLADYENAFLNDFERLKKREPYRSYLYSYKLPYFTVADMFSTLLNYQSNGLIDEIIISNDDFQLPNSISYFDSLNKDLVTKENNSPVKFSFARTYMSTGVYSIAKQLMNTKGENYTASALSGKNQDVNFIFGTDEIPQLIYARILSKRTQKTTDFNLISKDSDKIDTFDVVSVNLLLKNAVNFVKNGQKKSVNKTDLYLYNYNIEKSPEDTIAKIKQSIAENKNTGVIEIYSNEILNTGDNNLFKRLTENSKNEDDPDITDLAFYSAWNTNANAIGLGVAHAQVYAISKEITDSPENMLLAQVKMLSQHLIEDGIYTCNTKRILSNEGYIPNSADKSESEKLISVLNYDDILKSFKNKSYTIKDNTYTISDNKLKEYCFPWGRTFECYLDFDISLSNEKP